MQVRLESLRLGAVNRGGSDDPTKGVLVVGTLVADLAKEEKLLSASESTHHVLFDVTIQPVEIVSHTPINDRSNSFNWFVGFTLWDIFTCKK